MQWEKQIYAERKWHKWFAWYPVSIGNRRYWLEYVERLKHSSCVGNPPRTYFTYRCVIWN